MYNNTREMEDGSGEHRCGAALGRRFRLRGNATRLGIIYCIEWIETLETNLMICGANIHT